MSEVNARGTTVPARFVVYTDSAGNQIITLPRDLETILAGAYQASNPDAVNPGTFWCGRPIPIQNQWYAFAPSGPGNVTGSNALEGIKRLSGRYTTFADWDEPMKLRVKLEEDESPGKTIIFRGYLSGVKKFTNGLEGVPLSFSNATATTVQTFDQPPYQIIKPVTKGPIELWAVDATTADETLVAMYEPSETNPSYARWIVPVCPEDET